MNDIKDINGLVSIIIPSYNHEKYITECIESIISQTYKNFELIVIDDGSKDNSREILEALKTKYNFTLVFQENQGIAFTLNRGIKEFSHGEYLTFCASDDFWLLDKLEKQVRFMENNRYYPMCYGKTFHVDESSNILKVFDKENNSLKGGWIFEDIFLFRFYPPVNYLFRKNIFVELGYYDEDVFAEDYYMNLKISSKYPIGFIDDYLGFYRYDSNPAKISRFEIVSDSHLMAIENFKSHRLYKRAKRYVYLRKFDTFSKFTVHKKKALKNLFKSLPLCYDKQFLKAIIKLIIYWKG